jgi:hypothetical protein
MSLWSTGQVITAALLNQKELYIGTTAPASPTDGQLWYDTTNHQLKEYHADVSAWFIIALQVFSGSPSIANTETQLFDEATTNSIIVGWIQLPAQAITWTLNMYIAGTLWHQIQIAGNASTPTLIKIAEEPIVKIGTTVQDVKVTAYSNSSTAYTINWIYVRFTL